MREIKFRGKTLSGEWVYGYYIGDHVKKNVHVIADFVSKELIRVHTETVGQYTGIKDKNGVEIYFGDKIRFADKWEWYKGSYGIKMHFAKGERLAELRKQYEAEPYEERTVDDIADYELLLLHEIQEYWEVIGNIHDEK